jgi:hypothetical protein
MKGLVLLLIAVVLGGCSFMDFTSAQDDPDQWGGPYWARTFGGQDLIHREGYEAYTTKWENDQLVINLPERSFGVSFSVEFDPGEYEIEGDCILYPDPERTGRGDLNSPHVGGRINFTKPAWGLIYVPLEVTHCTFRKL